MILVPYFLVGAFLLKIARRPLHKAVGVGACIYGLWLLYASGPVHLLLSVILYAPGLLVFLYARRTHQHDRPLKRRDTALIGFAGCRRTGNVDVGRVSGYPAAELKGDLHG